MANELTSFDPAEGLTSDYAIVAFIAEAGSTLDAKYISHARKVVARAEHLRENASLTGLTGNRNHRQR